MKVNLLIIVGTIALASPARAIELRSAGSILVRQRGSHIRPGGGVGEGRDHTLFALRGGKVAYERVGKDGRRVSVAAAP